MAELALYVVEKGKPLLTASGLQPRETEERPHPEK
jgi:hypothetical protein